MRIFSKIEKTDKTLIFLVVYRKRTSYNKFNSDLKFNLIISQNYPKIPPVINCVCNFIQPTIYDNRNLLLSILGQEWMTDNTLFEIIEKIPDFCERIVENNNQKYMVDYGDYKIDEVYDINNFLMNNELCLFKSYQLIIPKASILKNKLKKDRYIVLTDIYFMLFDPAPNYKNMAKLLFWGDIRQTNITKTEYFSEEEKAYSYNIRWKHEGAPVIDFEVIFMNYFTNNNLVFNPVQDFIEILNKKISKLKENFKIFHEDYNKPLVHILNKGNPLENLISLIKYNESQMILYKTDFLINNLNYLYKKINFYLKSVNDPLADVYQKKIKNITNDKEKDLIIFDEVEYKFNTIKSNFELSRSFVNSCYEEFI